MPSKPEENPPAVEPATAAEIYDPDTIREFQAAVERGNESVRGGEEKAEPPPECEES